MTDNETNEKQGVRSRLGWLGSGLGITLAVILVVILLISWAFFSLNSVQKDGTSKQAALNAQYLDNQNELSRVTITIKEQLGVANLKADKLDEVLTDAVKGRYDGDLSAATPDEGSKLISALVEAYPDLSGLDAYDRILDTISAGREAYANKQSKLLDMLREYDTWRRSGIIHSKVVSIAGFPSDGLEARIGTKVVRGQTALDQMYLIVLVEGTTEAYETGVIEPTIGGEEPQK